MGIFPTLTKRQKELLDFIKVYSELNGFAPSLLEIKNHFRLSAISTVHEHIENLKRKGFIDKEMNQARSIRPVNQNLQKSEVTEIPLLGELDSEMNMIEVKKTQTFLLHKHFLEKSAQYFAVSANGHLEELGIMHKDVLIFKQQSSAKPGDIILVEIARGHQIVQKAIFEDKSLIVAGLSKRDPSPRIVAKLTNIIRTYP